MKTGSSLLVALLATFLITACGEKPAEEAASAATEAATEAVGEAAEAATEAAGSAAAAATEAVAEVATGAGGYEPTAEERVEGITMSAEELAAQAAAIDAGNASN